MRLIKKIFENLPGKSIALSAITAASLGFYSLLNPTNASASERNWIYSGLPRNTEIRLPLSPTSKTDLIEYFKAKAKMGEISFNATSTETAVKNINNYIGARGVPCVPCESDSASVRYLDKAVEDGVIDEHDSLFVDGEFRIKPGRYTILVRSHTITDPKCKNAYTGESMPFFVEIIPSALEKKAEAVEEPRKLLSTPICPPKKICKEGKEWKLIVDGIIGEKISGIQIGTRYACFGASLNFLKSDDETTRELKVPLSVGRHGYGIENEINQWAIGLAGEIHPIEPLFFGIGTDYWNLTRRIKESIASENGDVLKSNTNSKSEHEFSTKVYGGVEIPVKGRFNLRASGFYDDRKGFGGGVGTSIRLNTPQKKPNHRK